MSGNNGSAPTQCVGPDFKAQDQKPSATVSVKVDLENVHVLPQTPQLIALLS
jgi:uracil phosphoribosyltransferase